MIPWPSLDPSGLAFFFFFSPSELADEINSADFTTSQALKRRKSEVLAETSACRLNCSQSSLPFSPPPHFSSSKKLLPGTWLKLILVVSFRHLGFGQLARLGSWSPSEPFKLPESFDQVPTAHQHNGDFKLASWLKFNKIFINVLGHFFGTSIIGITTSILNTVCTVTDIEFWGERENKHPLFLSLLVLAVWSQGLGCVYIVIEGTLLSKH